MTSLVKNNGGLQPWKEFFDSDDFLKGLLPTRMLTNFPAVNVSETKENFLIEVAVPGFKKDELKVSVEDGILKISAENKIEKEEEQKDFTRREFSFKSFERSFHLPENISNESIGAFYENGILKLTLPKMESKVKSTKEIAVS